MKTTLFWPMALLVAALACPAHAQPVYNISTVAGSAAAPNGALGGLATAFQLGAINGVASDRLGNLYLSDTTKSRILKVDTSGTITAFFPAAGTSTTALLSSPYGLAFDASGNLYVADYGSKLVRCISPGGAISTVAGGGSQADAPDGSPATSVPLQGPRNLAFDALGNLYISEFDGARVRKVDTSGNIWTVAGTGVPGANDESGPATYAQLNSPAGLAVDGKGNLYVADCGVANNSIRKISLGTGIMSTLPALSIQGINVLRPLALAVDGNSTLYASSGAGILSYTQAGQWGLFAGQWSAVNQQWVPGYSGDGGIATSAELTDVLDLTVSSTGIVYMADFVAGSTLVRSVNRSLINTVAGTQSQTLPEAGDGGPATSATLSSPSAVALDHSGNLFIADTGFQRIRQVASSGVITTAGGTGAAGYNGDGIPAVKAMVHSPSGVAVDSAGSLVVPDTINNRVRRVNGGVIGTVVGTGIGGSIPQPTPPLQTPLNYPSGVCYDLAGNQYIVDQNNNRVLQVPPGSGLAVTIAGQADTTPGSGAAGDGGLARSAHLYNPTACATDASGNLYIADTGNHRIRKVNPAGIISTVAGTGMAGTSGDEGPAKVAALNGPLGVAVDGSGNVFIGDTKNHLVRMVTADGVIHTIAGTGSSGFAGDGGSAQIAQLYSPAGVTVDGSGNVYVADSGNNRVRVLSPQAAQQVTPPTSPVTPIQPGQAPVVAVENAASMAQGAVAPGELVTIVGAGLGPQSSAAGALNAVGQVPGLLAGTEVDFGGVAAPVFSTQYSQVTVQVPYTVAGSVSTPVTVLYLGQTVGAANVALAVAAPGLFPQVWNQDGSANSSSNPAPAGSTVIVYGTGEGQRNGSNIAGLPAAAPYASPVQPAVLTIGGAVASLAFSGAAPGQVGVIQVNAVVPGTLPSGLNPVVLTVGTVSSPAVAMWVK